MNSNPNFANIIHRSPPELRKPSAVLEYDPSVPQKGLFNDIGVPAIAADVKREIRVNRKDVLAECELGGEGPEVDEGVIELGGGIESERNT